MTFVILSGGIDLSVGSIVALAGVVLGDLAPGGSPDPDRRDPGAGGRHGLRPGQRRADQLGRSAAFIVTLGTMSIARGAALLFTEGRPVSGFDASFRVLATGASGSFRRR